MADKEIMNTADLKNQSKRQKISNNEQESVDKNIFKPLLSSSPKS